MKRIQLVLALPLLLFVAKSPLAASFNCAKAYSTNEKLICADAELSRLDDELGVSFRAAYEASQDKAGFKRNATAEWKVREQDCQDRKCLLDWYQRRLGETRNMAGTHVTANQATFKSSVGKESPNELSNQILLLGKKFGFDIPLTQEDFLRRYSTAGGQCGVQPGSELFKAVVPSMTSSCWVSRCPAFSTDLDCRMARTGFDANKNLVLFNIHLKEKTPDRLKSPNAISAIADRMTQRSGKSPEFKNVPKGMVIVNGANEGSLRYEFNVIALDGEPEGGLFWITADH